MRVIHVCCTGLCIVGPFPCLWPLFHQLCCNEGLYLLVIFFQHTTWTLEYIFGTKLWLYSRCSIGTPVYHILGLACPSGLLFFCNSLLASLEGSPWPLLVESYHLYFQSSSRLMIHCTDFCALVLYLRWS